MTAADKTTLLVDPRIHTDGPLTCLNCAVLNRKGKCKLLGRPPAEQFVAGTRRDECCPAKTADERERIENALKTTEKENETCKKKPD